MRTTTERNLLYPDSPKLVKIANPHKLEIIDQSGNSVITFPNDIFTPSTSTTDIGSIIKFNATNYAFANCGSSSDSNNIQNSATAQSVMIEFLNGTKILRSTCEVLLVLSRFNFL